jgi:hypothetical protein
MGLLFSDIVMLSVTKHLSQAYEILRFAQHDNKWLFDNK